LYQKIADCFDLDLNEILYCTLNTHEVDMSMLVGAHVGLDDFIYAHRRGQAKELELEKSRNALGMTISDNGNGFCFIKRIRENSVANIPQICVGDHIEMLNGMNMVGMKHFEVARLLAQIPTGSTFSLRLIEPMKSGFQILNDRAQASTSTGSSSKSTLRFKCNGKAEIEGPTQEQDQAAIDRINTLLENLLGFSDSDLAARIWELSAGKKTSMEFANAIDNSDLEVFGFTDDFVIELWCAISVERRKIKNNNKPSSGK